MATVTVCIGNSDDELSQREWSEFVRHVADAIDGICGEIHFSGHGDGGSPRQDAAWVIDVIDEDVAPLGLRLTGLRKAFRQQSVAFVVGETKLI